MESPSANLLTRLGENRPSAFELTRRAQRVDNGNDREASENATDAEDHSQPDVDGSANALRLGVLDIQTTPNLPTHAPIAPHADALAESVGGKVPKLEHRENRKLGRTA